MKNRLPSFCGLLGVFFLIIAWPAGGPWIFAFASAAAIYLLLLEMAHLLEKLGLQTLPRTAATAGGLLVLLRGFLFLSDRMRIPSLASWMTLTAMVVLGVLLFGGWVLLLVRHWQKELLPRVAATLGMLLLCLTPFVFLLEVYYNYRIGITLAGTREFFHVGAAHLLFLVLVTKMMDTGGYIVGMLSGRFMPGGNHKIVPKISPKKSWEGTIGGILFSMGAGWGLYALGWGPHGRGLPWVLGVSFVLALGSFAGDLTESALKRAAEVKDSGTLIPGMGGVFDVLDSFLYNGLLFTLCYTLIR